MHCWLAVSIPKMSDPVTPLAPPAATAGNTMIVPLLSVANCDTGFKTWLVSGTPIEVQAVDVHE